MTAGSTHRMAPSVLADDRVSLLALKSLNDYSPMNPSCTTDALQASEMALSCAEEEEIIARRAYEVARERAIEAGRVFHNNILAAKSQVIAQYGADSPVVHAVGLKKKSERERPVRQSDSPAKQ